MPQTPEIWFTLSNILKDQLTIHGWINVNSSNQICNSDKHGLAGTVEPVIPTELSFSFDNITFSLLNTFEVMWKT